jgi:hypothetical protein
MASAGCSRALVYSMYACLISCVQTPRTFVLGYFDTNVLTNDMFTSGDPLQCSGMSHALAQIRQSLALLQVSSCLLLGSVTPQTPSFLSMLDSAGECPGNLALRRDVP